MKLFSKKFCLLAYLIFMAAMQLQAQPDSLAQNKETETYSNVGQVNFRLYPTNNNWNFIKLDTRSGEMWMVQYSLESDKKFQYVLNYFPLAVGEEAVANRFVLRSTKNIWNFILLDQIDGRIWQVQWSFEPENRGIWQIE
jgi:hypothetical protein